MADRYPNIPSMPVEITDGNLLPDQVPAGAIVAVVGSAKKGPALVETRILSESGGVTRFGREGSLSRGIAEVFQGGGNQALAMRMYATAPVVRHIGDDTGVAGITLTTAIRGSDALAQYNVIYDSLTDRLRVYNATSGQVVLDKTGEVVAVDNGEISLEGLAANDYDANPQIFGSIGKKLNVLPDESEQLATLNNDRDELTMVAAVGLNLGRLGFLGAQTPIVAQILSEDGTERAEVRISGVNITTGIVTLAAPLDASFAAITSGADEHFVRFVSLYQAERFDRVVLDRLAIDGRTDILVSPGSDFNGLAKVVNSDSVTANLGLVEVEPHKMNIYEALVDVEGLLEASRLDAMVVLGAYADDPALDGQTVGETKLPTTLAEGLLVDSAVNANAGFDAVLLQTIAEAGDRVILTAADNAERDALATKLLSVGRGNSWIVVSEPLGADFGDGRESDELVRTARILNWENVGVVEVTTVATRADVGDDLDADHFRFHDGTTAYYVWYDASGAAVDPAVAAHTGIEVTIDTGDTAEEVAIATQAAIQSSAARVTVGRAGSTLTITNLDVANVTAATAQTSGFTVTVTQAGTDPQLTLHLDRELGFSLDGDGLVDADLEPAFKIYGTGLMFYHRKFVKNGENVHCWYTSKFDPEGNEYHEVNFAYRLGAICHELTQAETPVLGYMGVRPPANLYRKKDLDRWIGTSPRYDEDGNVVRNGSGLLGNKFRAGLGLNNQYDSVSQFAPGYLLTANGELDGEDVVVDANDFPVDLGKYLCLVSSWVILTNLSDTSRLGYAASAANLVCGLANGLAPWASITQKTIGSGGARVPVPVSKANINDLSGLGYVVLSTDSAGNTIVVDGPSAALPTSDFTRNMSMRLMAELVRAMRDAGRPFLGDPLDSAKKLALETALTSAANRVKQSSQGALQEISLSLTQNSIERRLGQARVRLSININGELRKLYFELALTA